MSPPKSQSQETIDSIIEMVSRNDEKMKTLIQNHEGVSNDLAQVIKDLSQVKLSLESYKLQVNNLNNFWEKVFDSSWKLALMVIGAAILYFLRLQSPPS
jgi:archaellum component FlaC